MPRGYPDPRIQPLPVEYLQPSANPLLLKLSRRTGKLRPAMHRHHPVPFRHTNMLVAVKANRCPLHLHGAHLTPKSSIGRPKLQTGVLIVRHYRQNRAYSKLP